MKKLFKNKKITIMGLGLHGGGVGTAKFFCEQGANVLVTDLKDKSQLKESISKLSGLKVKYVLGHHRQEDFIGVDLIIRNPGVPKESYFLKVARENKAPIETDITIFFKLCKSQIIGVTGTKGKSTTATLIYEFLKRKYKNTVLAGNIGISPLEILPKIDKNTKVVLELSSFELEDLEKSPNMAVITSIYQDHLNRYKDFNEYLEAKKNIFKYQKKGDILILDGDSELVKNFGKESVARPYFYSKKETKENAGCFLKRDEIFFGKEEEPVCELGDFKIFGEHNVSNILAAATVAKLSGVSNEKIKTAARKFSGVPSRQEFVREVRGVKYFNDTTATMPDACQASLETFSKRFPKANIILIAGGQDKNLDYRNLAREIQNKVNCVVLLPGTASEKLQNHFERGKPSIIKANSMQEAVKKAADIAKEGDIVLLSPAAASFNLFKNEFDRGGQFVKFVKQLPKNG